MKMVVSKRGKKTYVKIMVSLITTDCAVVVKMFNVAEHWPFHASVDTTHKKKK